MMAVACVLCAGMSAVAAGPEALVRLTGADLSGGARDLFGDGNHGVYGVNYVYAAATGARSVMEAAFEVDRVPEESLFLHLRGRDDDYPEACPIRLTLNGRTVFEGHSSFPSDAFAWQAWPVPSGALQKGINTLRIENTAPEGGVGMPPWFMVARILVGPENLDVDAPPPFEDNAVVILPDERRPLPEPLAEGQKPGFALRGTKGWLWRPEQYLQEVPTLAALKMNFLMICYGSMCDIEHYAWGDPRCNRWYEPLPEEKRAAYDKVLEACQAHGIELCLSLNPNLSSARALDYRSDADFEALWQHYDWMQQKGMKWFSVCLDDISHGIDAAGQAHVVNRLFERLRAGDPEAQFIFCPTYYWGDGSEPGAAAYLEILARDLHPEVYCFWTGNGVVGRITRDAAEAYKARIGHPLVIWDNYPVNDATLTMHLGPVTGRDSDLGEVCYGYMSNPMHTENEINRLPLATCADYAYNPWAYDPHRSIGQAILWQGETPEQREVLRELVELFPGMLVYRAGTNYNPAIERFTTLLHQRHNRPVARAFLSYVEDLATRFDAAFPDRYDAEKSTLGKTIDALRRAWAECDAAAK